MGSLDAGTCDYAWAEVSPRRWERDIDEVEQFYASLAKTYEGTGRCCFAITGYISFSVQGTDLAVENALRKAWVRLRFENPTIASRVEYDGQRQKCRKVYEAFSSPEAQNTWLQDTFRVVRTKTSGLQWCNSDPAVPGLPTIFLIKRAARQRGTMNADLVLRCRHDIMDGVGALMLLDSLFAHAAQAFHQGDAYSIPVFEDEWSRLSPPLRVAAGISPILSKQQEARLARTVSWNAALKKDVEIAGFPHRKNAMKPGKHQRVAITLSTESTHRVVKACRALGLTLNHAYHTAIGIILRDLQKRQARSRTVRYVNYNFLDERPQCQEPYNTASHAASVYHSVSGECLAVDLTVPAASIGAPEQLLDHSIRRRQEFMRVASAVRRFDLQNRNDKQRIQMVPSYWAMITPPWPTDNATPAIPVPYNKPSVSLSDLGEIDNVVSSTHGAFSLDNPWVTREHLVTGLALFLGTWDGQLTLSATYNDAWHTRNEALAFLDRCNVITIQALGA
ncbi:uncharacterized protein DSM5745_10375 [Aspergillus mulundensis]|uniref:Condensation domain-containing protein n=1 Tax=Aspergillus mulundensis TaxID=1810919 RepID=A0A3D8QIP7_9EURO|nr:Uncharacterized protein DSM5745_10375 [Aspergillus mulundensis]RDW61703.1 Uncharacterized protein DSM5745_10375 [Aspergillus mulundensis]